jgi:MarR family transcriptional regulator for hemolysin
MTLRQWEVLAWLSRNGALSQTKLAECLQIEPHTLTGVISRMERDGWLERIPCPKDRRRHMIHPTPHAEVVWARAAEWCHDVRKQALVGFSDDEVRMFKQCCERIQRNLGADCAAEEPCLGEMLVEPSMEAPPLGVA